MVVSRRPGVVFALAAVLVATWAIKCRGVRCTFHEGRSGSVASGILDVTSTANPGRSGRSTKLYDNFEELCHERARTDREIEDFVAALSPERLAEDFTYQTYAGTTFTHSLGPALVHLFNHQTHHRGQLTTLLNQRGIDSGVTDAMIYYRQHRQ
jgi:uncharacterized damage-inducible protein DinB